MKYHSDSGFDIVTRNRYVNLIKHLFAHYDQFVAEVVGDDFEQSVYRNLLYPTASHDYYRYRRHRAYHYKEARRKGYPYQIKELIPFEEFEQNFQAPIIKAELSCLYLFIYGMEKTFNHNSIVHDKNSKCFKLKNIMPGLFDSMISEIIAGQFPNLSVIKAEDCLSCRFYTTDPLKESLELIPVYMFIFKVLKKKNLDFKYKEISSKMFAQFMGFFTKNLAEMQIQEILNSDTQSTLDDDDMDRAIYNREQSDKHADVKQMLNMISPPIIVQAYFNVYGKLPVNYPVVEE